MSAERRYRGEAVLAAKFTAVSLLGFATDATVLHLLLWAGLEPAWARVVSLLAAMHVTFVVNGRHVFRGLERTGWPRRWISYLAANGFGNFCNYWIFVTLVSIHGRIVANPLFALAAASVSAWAINYAANRLWVFRPRRRSPPGNPSDVHPVGGV